MLASTPAPLAGRSRFFVGRKGKIKEKREKGKKERRYRVIHKKLSHKTEDKMQEKMKMILQVNENLAHL